MIHITDLQFVQLRSKPKNFPYNIRSCGIALALEMPPARSILWFVNLEKNEESSVLCKPF